LAQSTPFPLRLDAFARPNAKQRVSRLLALSGQPSLHHVARELGIRHAILASQVCQLEAVTGTTLLRTGPGGTITLTADGEQFARDASSVLESLAQFRQSKSDNHGTLPLTPTKTVQLSGAQPATDLRVPVQLQRNTQLSVFKFTRSLHGL
jgi:DNA-binding transcriptional LysR family regulator